MGGLQISQLIFDVICVVSDLLEQLAEGRSFHKNEISGDQQSGDDDSKQQRREEGARIMAAVFMAGCKSVYEQEDEAHQGNAVQYVQSYVAPCAHIVCALLCPV